MKQRIITGALCAVLLLPVLFFYNTLIFNLVIAIISAVSVFEVLQAAGLHKNPAFLAVCILFAAGVPFVSFAYFSFLSFFFMALIFVVLIFTKNSLNFEKVGTVFPMLVFVPFGMAATVYLRDFNEHGLFYLFLAMIGSWVTDIGAYFIGSFWGKHKLIERISPKKTVEGAVGGFVSCIVCFALAAWIYQRFFLGDTATVSIWMLVLLSIPCSLVGMVGDLAASLVKRNCHVKDYGNILPGHGGMLDRFDSFVFVTPLIYCAVYFIPFIS